MSSAIPQFSLPSTYKCIGTCCLESSGKEGGNGFLNKMTHWRDKDPSIVRKITFGLTLALSAIAGLVDTVASVALGILSSPLELVGYQFSRRFFKRAIASASFSGGFLTIAQYENLFQEKLFGE